MYNCSWINIGSACIEVQVYQVSIYIYIGITSADLNLNVATI